MLKKNIEKEQRKNRKTWVRFYSRKTPTKKQLEKKLNKKHKGKYSDDYKQYLG